MGPLGHFATGMAAKRFAPGAPLLILLIASWLLDLLAITLQHLGVDRDPTSGNPWSHGLLMSLCWSVLAGVLSLAFLRDRRAAIVIGVVVFGHWVLDLISHPIPFNSFSMRTWQWHYGQPLAPDLPILFAGSLRVGFGLYNRISAVEATLLEAVMFVAGTVIYLRGRSRSAPKAE